MNFKNVSLVGGMIRIRGEIQMDPQQKFLRKGWPSFGDNKLEEKKESKVLKFYVEFVFMGHGSCNNHVNCFEKYRR